MKNYIHTIPTTTLRKLRAANACKNRYAYLVSGLDGTKYVYRNYNNYVDAVFTDDQPITIEYILNHNGLDDALWALRAVDGWEMEKQLFACLCAENVQPLSNDKCCDMVVATTRKFAMGDATEYELEAAWVAARDDTWVDAWIDALVAARKRQKNIFLLFLKPWV